MALRKSKDCLNCGRKIGNYNYCPDCGQANTHKHISTRQIVHDFFGDYFTFDSKFFHSLFPLICKPGHLTREYTSGKRVSYILPLRLYLFTTFIFFFILSINAKVDQKHFSSPDNIRIVGNDSLKTALKEEMSEIPEKQRNRVASLLDIDLDENTESEADTAGRVIAMNLPESSGISSKISDYLEQKATHLSEMGEDGPTLFIKACINQFPKVLFFLLPIFALFLKLIYIRHRYFYVEHLIFALHSHTFFFIILIPCALFPHWYIILPALLLVYLYLFLAVRQFYQQSFWKTWFKLNTLLTLYSMTLIPAVILLFVLAIVSV